jgi:hypothetical protein
VEDVLKYRGKPVMGFVMNKRLRRWMGMKRLREYGKGKI